MRHRFIWGDIQPENWANVVAYGVYLQASKAWPHLPTQKQVHPGNPKASDTFTRLAQGCGMCNRVVLLGIAARRVSGFSKTLDDLLWVSREHILMGSEEPVRPLKNKHVVSLRSSLRLLLFSQEIKCVKEFNTTRVRVDISWN